MIWPLISVAVVLVCERQTVHCVCLVSVCILVQVHSLHEWHVHTSAACVCMAACAGLKVVVMSVPEACDACCLFLRWDDCRRRTEKDG